MYDPNAFRTRYRFILIAAVFLVLLALGIVYLVYDSNEEEPGSLTSEKDSQVQDMVEATPEAKYVIGDPLFLALDSPASLELVVKEPSLVVRGKTRMDALLTVGSDVVEPNLDGGFSHTITLEPGHNLVEILASTSSGEKNSLILAVIYSP